MSTFNGVIAEFPDLRVDFFRRRLDAPPPLVCLLSHVHSDHLAGLESLRSPFVYCSAATREMVLRLERHHCRINFAKGILETRRQTYKHLVKVLKPLPLETPTAIEVRPGCRVQVTLFDANHCPGAVMFLIEGNAKAVLYTGDMRSEPWFVSALTRSPLLVEYTTRIKTLDTIYLDTTHTADRAFEANAQGVAQLVRAVLQYSATTVFYVQAYTFGYEHVWIALSKALKSRIHVDDYKLRIYSALRHASPDHHLDACAAALVGHMCANTPHAGCLTADESVRLHSCDPPCAAARGADVVRIQPVVARGVTDHGSDLQRRAELAVASDGESVARLMQIISSSSMPGTRRHAATAAIQHASSTGRNAALALDLDDGQTTSLHTALAALSRHPHPPATNAPNTISNALNTISNAPDTISNASNNIPNAPSTISTPLPRRITFPFSRHSSYPELCAFVRAFQPRDVWPCTFDAERWAAKGISIKSLFGACCSADVFAHDAAMGFASSSEAQESTCRESYSQGGHVSSGGHGSSGGRGSLASDCVIPTTCRQEVVMLSGSSQASKPITISDDSFSQHCEPVVSAKQPSSSPVHNPPSTFHNAEPILARHSSPSTAHNAEHIPPQNSSPSPVRNPEHTLSRNSSPSKKRKHNQVEPSESQESADSIVSAISDRHSIVRRDAYRATLRCAAGIEWAPVSLLCVETHGVADDEL